MNIGHDLMRRFGPRTTRAVKPPPPSVGQRIVAIAVTVAGAAGLLALGWIGRGSEPVARVSVGAAAVLLGLSVLAWVIDWIRRPIHETASFDAGDVFERLVTPRDIRSARAFAAAWTRSTLRGTLVTLTVVSVLVAFGLAQHWKWIPTYGSSRGPRGALAPAVPPPAPPARP
ncbi:MAG: hypothetical protein ACKOFI_06045 [Phycisphaerales bacterium]